MEKISGALSEVARINGTYQISNEPIHELILEMKNAKVCTPIIGRFSSGKSAIINTVLGYKRKILKEDILPQTAIPAEIIQSDEEDSITIFSVNGTAKNIEVEEYREYTADANQELRAVIRLRNDFLRQIPDVMLVDMPGFESGYEVHNKAIDDYLPRSLAYIIAFPADDMIVRNSVGNILKELCLHDMPLCVAITKYDKRTDTFNTSLKNLDETLRKYIGNREIRYCKTSSVEGNAEELEDFLVEIQSKSQEIFANRYRRTAISILETTENYLKTSIKNSELSESELDEQEERLTLQTNRQMEEFAKERECFDHQVEKCITEVKGDILKALETEESTLVSLVMNGQEIKEHINAAVRNAVTKSVESRLTPIITKYIKNVEGRINEDCVSEIRISLNNKFEADGKQTVSQIAASIVGLVLGGPIMAILVGGIVGFIKKHFEDKKREEKKAEIRAQIRSEVYPQVLMAVGSKIELAIIEHVKFINTSIDAEINNQKNILEKAINDIRLKKTEEASKKETRLIGMNTDLQRIGEIRDGL